MNAQHPTSVCVPALQNDKLGDFEVGKEKSMRRWTKLHVSPPVSSPLAIFWQEDQTQIAPVVSFTLLA